MITFKANQKEKIMSRKSIGGTVIQSADLKKAIDSDKNCMGLILKIPNPKDQSGVALEVYGALISSDGLTEGKRIKCELKSCSIKKKAEKSDLKAYEFEHCDQFSLFNSGEPFIAYFSRSQIDMLFSLGKFDKVYVASFMPISSNPMVNTSELIPNFNLEMQPLILPKKKKAKNKINTKSTINSYGLPGTVRAAGCPRTWRQE